MIDERVEDEGVDERGLEGELVECLEGTEPEHIADLAGGVVAHGEAPVCTSNVDALFDDLDLIDTADAESSLVGEADVWEVHRVKAHEVARDGVDRDGVGSGEQDVLLHRNHGSRSRSVPGGGAIRHSKDAGVDLLLDG